MASSIIDVKRPAWLAPKSPTEQITVIPRSKIGGMSQPKPFNGTVKSLKQAMMQEQNQSGQKPLPVVINEGEEVVPAGVVNAMGGSQGLTQALNKALPAGQQLTGDRGTAGAYSGQGIKGMAAGTVGVDYAKYYSDQARAADAAQAANAEPASTAPASVAMPELAIPVPRPSQVGTSLAQQYSTAAQNTPLPTPQRMPGEAVGDSSIANPAPRPAQVGENLALQYSTAAQNTRLPTPQRMPGEATGDSSIANPSPIAQTATGTAPAQNTLGRFAGIAGSATATEPLPAIPQPSQPAGGIAKLAGNLLESPAARATRLASQESLQQQQAAQRIAASQSMAQQGQTGAALQAGMAQQNADFEGVMGKAAVEMQAGNAKRAEGMLMDAATMAINAGDYTGANKAISAAGLPPVDFSKVIAKEKNADLISASDDLITIAKSFTESNPALASLLMGKAMELRGQVYKGIANVEFDPDALATAMTAMDTGDYENPALQALVGKVAPGILDWFSSTEGQSSLYKLTGSPKAKAIFDKITAGTATPDDMQQLGYVMALTYDNMNGRAMSDGDMATLSSWGLWTDITKPTASVRPVNTTGTEPTPAVEAPAPVIPLTSQPAGPGTVATQPTGETAPTLAIPVGNNGQPTVTELGIPSYTGMSVDGRDPNGHGWTIARTADGAGSFNLERLTMMNGTELGQIGYAAISSDYHASPEEVAGSSVGSGNLHVVTAADNSFYTVGSSGSGSTTRADRGTFTSAFTDKIYALANSGTPITLNGQQYTIDPAEPISKNMPIGSITDEFGLKVIGIGYAGSTSMTWYADAIKMTDANGQVKYLTMPIAGSWWDQTWDKGNYGINYGVTLWDESGTTPTSVNIGSGSTPSNTPTTTSNTPKPTPPSAGFFSNYFSNMAGAGTVLK